MGSNDSNGSDGEANGVGRTQDSIKSSTEREQSLMSQATTSARQIAEDVATGVKVAVTEAVAWADKKVEELSERNEDIGPYGSSATCAPSDFEVITPGVLPIMAMENNTSQEDSKQKGVDKSEDNDQSEQKK